MNEETYEPQSSDNDSVELTHVQCRLCGERWHESCEDDALIHVNNEHTIREQIGVLVKHSDGVYSTPFTDDCFDTEYDARTSVMAHVPKMKRLSALVCEAYSPVEDLGMMKQQP